MRLPLRISRLAAESELNHALKQTKASNTQIRIRAVLAVAKGKTIRQAAQTISIAARTIQNWVNNYNREGLEGIRDHHTQGRKSKLNEQQKACLVERIQSGPSPQDKVCKLRAADVRRIIQDQFGHSYSLAGVYYMLHYQLALSYLKPRPKHHKADPEVQQAFKKTYHKS
jgi:transposase